MAGVNIELAKGLRTNINYVSGDSSSCGGESDHTCLPLEL